MKVFCIIIIFSITLQSTLAKSCHYNNLFAKPIWSTVKSPGYPGRFPAQTQCWWKITSPPQYRIQLEFIHFTLVQPNNRRQCVWQWLNVIEGGGDPDEGEPPMLTMCGNKRPKIIISSGNILQINLHSNAAAANSRYRGFEAKYKYTDDPAFIPTDVKMLLPDSQSSSSNPASSSVSGGGSRSLGSVIDSFAPSRPRPLPPNPNAVLTLQNRRTEARNQARNNGITNNNAMNNNQGPGFYRRPLGPQVPVRPITHKPLDNDNAEKQMIPPPRGRPLRYEIKILIAVLGTVGGIVLVAFVVKKLVFDRANKQKNEGDVAHAYAHFRHFKKTRKNDDVDSKVNTISASVDGVKATQSSNRNSSQSSSQSPPEVRTGRQFSSKNATSEMVGNGTDSTKERSRRRRGTDKEMVDPRTFREMQMQVTSTGSRNKTESKNNSEFINGGHVREDPPEYREIYNEDRERRKRKRTRKSRDNEYRYKMEARHGHHTHRGTNRRSNSREHQERSFSSRHSRRPAETSSSDYSSDGNRRGGSWRDRAYS